MAILKNKIVRQITPMTPRAGKLAEWSNDARRLMILGRRAIAGELIGPTDPNTTSHSIIDPYIDELSENKGNQKIVGDNVGKHSAFSHNDKSKVLNDFVAIIDIDAGGYNKGYKTIKLPFIPRELNYDPQSTFAAIKAIGRNTAKYQYTGSEDILEFEIDWYAHDYERREVIENCRKIEALSKSDGYNGDPHRVMLLWGDGDVLFKDHIFLVLSAKYRLTNFNKGYLNNKKEIVNTNMLPIQAYQTVRLGRISSYNLTKNAIEYVEYKPTTRGTSGVTVDKPSLDLR